MLFSISLLGLLAISSSASTVSEYAKINSYIRGLLYDPNEALVYRGEEIKQIGDSSEHVDNQGNFYFVHREKKEVRNPNLNLGFVDLNDHRIYPGALVRANDNLLNQKPDVVTIDRNNIRYSVTLQGMTDDGIFDAEPVFSNYRKALEAVKNAWFMKHTDDQITPAKFTVEKNLVRSKEQLKVKFGLSADIIAGSIDFEAVDKDEKVVYVYKFIQTFYQVSVDYPENPADIFGANVTSDQVMQHFDDKNPPLFVDSVTYGRCIYVTIETTSSEKEVKAVLSSKLPRVPSVGAEYTRELENLQISVFVYGGGAEHINIIKARSFEEVEEVIIKYASFTRTNPGVPIFYSMAFLKDNSAARVSGVTEYVDVKNDIRGGATLVLEDESDLITRWYLDWNQETVDPGTGKKTLEHKEWKKSGIWRFNPFRENVFIPGNAKNIHFKVQLFKVPFNWKTMVEYSNLSFKYFANGKTFKVIVLKGNLVGSTISFHSS